MRSQEGGPGIWTFAGRDGYGQWPRSGAIANLTVVRFDAGGVVIRRVDKDGRTPGLIATYTGSINGKRIDGNVTWSWPGLWNGSSTGKWFATLPPWSVPGPQNKQKSERNLRKCLRIFPNASLKSAEYGVSTDEAVVAGGPVEPSLLSLSKSLGPTA